MEQEQFGTDTPVYKKLRYNSRQQLSELRASTTPNDLSSNRGEIINWYSGQCGGAGCNNSDNNGNLRRQDVSVPNNEQNTSPTSWYQQYEYDNLNRLKQVHEHANNSQLWQQSYGYDRYGNRTITSASPGINAKQFDVQPATNRLYAQGDLNIVDASQRQMRYDLAGNLTNDSWTSYGSSTPGAVTRTYDAENRMTSALDSGGGTTHYTYNSDGQRVRRSISNQAEVWQVYGMDGELLAEYAANAPSAPPQKEYGYCNGQLLVEVTATMAGWGAPPAYTPPNPLVSGWEIKLEHLTELRSAVNQLRDHAGLPAFNFTVDPNPERNVTTVKAEHIRQLRIALEDARSHLGLSIGGYAHSTLTENSSWIYAIDFQELRNQIQSAWNSGTGGVDIRWLVADQLGTPRIIIDKTGALANVKRHDYLPFGEELVAGQGLRTSGANGLGYAADNVRQKFTSYERDSETGLDFAQARYYANPQGRFTSADPLMASAQTTNPQSFNRYTYTLNNPLMYVDPTGEDIALTGNEKDRKEELERMRKLLGDERFNLVDFEEKEISGLGTVTLMDFGSQENRSKFAAVGGNDAYEVEFSQGMADIIGSKEIVEYRLAETFQANNCLLCVCLTETRSVNEFGGAGTLNKDESLTGNVQIFVSRNATSKAFNVIENRRQKGIRVSSDGDVLTFTAEQIDAHEFGHGHNAVRWGMRVEPSERAVRWENILRLRQKSSNSRIRH